MSAKGDQEEGLVTFERRRVPLGALPDWEGCENTLTEKVHIDSVGTAVDDGHGMLQAGPTIQLVRSFLNDK